MAVPDYLWIRPDWYDEGLAIVEAVASKEEMGKSRNWRRYMSLFKVLARVWPTAFKVRLLGKMLDESRLSCATFADMVDHLESRNNALLRYRQEWRDRALAAEKSLILVRSGKATGWEHFSSLKREWIGGKATGEIPYNDYDEGEGK